MIEGTEEIDSKNTENNHLIETKVSSEYIYKGKIVNLRKDVIQLPNGNQSTREVVEHEQAVVVLPFQAPNKITLIKQFRYPIGKVVLEAPAGIMDPNESPLESAKRELAEETGLRANKWTSLGGAYPTPGFCDEFFHFFLAEELEKGETNFDHDENIECVEMTLEDCDQLVKESKFIDCKTELMYLKFKYFILNR